MLGLDSECPFGVKPECGELAKDFTAREHFHLSHPSPPYKRIILRRYTLTPFDTLRRYLHRLMLVVIAVVVAVVIDIVIAVVIAVVTAIL